MCDKCIKRSYGRELLDLELKMERIFDSIKDNPELEKDNELIDTMNVLDKKYKHLLKKMKI